MASVLVLPSPLLPGSAYRDLAAAFTDHGARADVASATLSPGEGAHDLVRRWSRTVEADTILVPHSNAGYLAPLVRALGSVRSPIVFMDAALPPPTGSTPLAPPRFRTFLAELADPDGLLPPWTRWWPRPVIDAVVPAGRFADLDRDCPRLPLSYVDATVDAPTDWTAGANAYLAFGDTYADELDLVRAGGWPHSAFDGGHLHFMHDPVQVAQRVLALAGVLRGARQADR
ncbi:MAG: hypothetical protein WCA30_07440 [Dermatophilaceae bacterium]